MLGRSSADMLVSASSAEVGCGLLFARAEPGAGGMRSSSGVGTGEAAAAKAEAGLRSAGECSDDDIVDYRRGETGESVRDGGDVH